jgi:hypothetical protein
MPRLAIVELGRPAIEAADVELRRAETLALVALAEPATQTVSLSPLVLYVHTSSLTRSLAIYLKYITGHFDQSFDATPPL